MADRLTQLQDAIDQLATIFYCALRYVGTHHDFIPTHGEQKIEVLIASLPGIGVSEDDQKERLKELGRELEKAEEERKKSIQEKEELLVEFDEVVRSLKRV
ncbi:hypothetical protein ABW20_dc0106621 [Dactylellina cionopaga]|nr:hypothetical protein ABW20_dc0106621 [Dactylellina cionopaga]